MISVLSHSESYRYYNSCYLNLVGYVLGQCFFTGAELEEIEKEVVRTFTLKLGYNQNMAKVIWDGSYDFAGVFFTTLIHVQGIEQIKTFFVVQDQTVQQQNSYNLHKAGHNIKLDGTH